MLDVMEVDSSGCRASLVTVPLFHALCGEGPAEMKGQGSAMRERLELELERAADAELDPGGWEVSRSVSRGSFVSHGRRIVAAIHHKSAELAVMYAPAGAACLSAAAREGASDAESDRPDGFVSPTVQSTVVADYPVEARRYRIEGSVLVGFRVEATGEVSEVCLATTDDRSEGLALAQAAMAAVWATPYRPATLKGKAVPALDSTIMHFTFGGVSHQQLGR
jgi:TonB family protein